MLGFNFSVLFQTSTSGSELAWTRQEALCHELRTSSPVLRCISHQECNWWAQAAPGFPSLPGTPVSLPGLGSSFHQLCSAQFASWETSLGTALAPFPTFPVGPGNKLSSNVLHLSVLLPVLSFFFWDKWAWSECSVSHGWAGSRAQDAADRERKGKEAAGSGPRGHE